MVENGKHHQTGLHIVYVVLTSELIVRQQEPVKLRTHTLNLITLFF